MAETGGGTRRRVLAWVAATPAALAACRFPADPEGTLRRIEGATLRVGVLDALPWAAWINGAAAGLETELVRAVAGTLDAEPAWHAPRDGNLHEALEAGEIDLLVGGLVADDPWKDRLAFSRPYLEVAWVAVDGLGRPLHSLEGIAVEAEPGTRVPSLVESAGGRAVRPGDPAAQAVARRAWTLPPGDAGAVAILTVERHVVAVRRGENAWLLTLERFLDGLDEASLRRALARADRP